VALLGLAAAATDDLDCNPFLVTDGRLERGVEDDASLNELVFLAEFSRFMNEKAPRLLQVCKTAIFWGGVGG
jgi:hypothetical protein